MKRDDSGNHSIRISYSISQAKRIFCLKSFHSFIENKANSRTKQTTLNIFFTNSSRRFLFVHQFFSRNLLHFNLTHFELLSTFFLNTFFPFKKQLSTANYNVIRIHVQFAHKIVVGWRNETTFA